MARTTTPLTDHVAIVTGAGQGIGKASALALADVGATVVAVDINEKTLAETAGEIRKLGGRALAIRADIGSVPEIDRLIGESMAAFGQIDILVNKPA